MGRRTSRRGRVAAVGVVWWLEMGPSRSTAVTPLDLPASFSSARRWGTAEREETQRLAKTCAAPSSARRGHAGRPQRPGRRKFHQPSRSAEPRPRPCPSLTGRRLRGRPRGRGEPGRRSKQKQGAPSTAATIGVWPSRRGGWSPSGSSIETWPSATRRRIRSSLPVATQHAVCVSLRSVTHSSLPDPPAALSLPPRPSRV